MLTGENFKRRVKNMEKEKLLGEMNKDYYFKKRLCDNASMNGNGMGISLDPQCYDNYAEYFVTITYGRNGKQDSFYLCKNCLNNLKKDAQRYGDKVTARKIRKDEKYTDEIII